MRSNGKVASILLNKADIFLLVKCKWNVSLSGPKLYTVRTTGNIWLLDSLTRQPVL